MLKKYIPSENRNAIDSHANAGNFLMTEPTCDNGDRVEILYRCVDYGDVFMSF